MLQRFFLRTFLFLGLLGLSFGAAGQQASRATTTNVFSQRRINEMAAALDTARRALIEDTGLRRPNEPLPEYFARLTYPLPGEERAQRNTRIEGYLKALEQATKETAAARRVPVLRLETPANRALWQQAARSLSYLPKRMTMLRADWRQEHQRSSRFGQGLTQTVMLIVTAYNALRDARP